VVLVVLIGLVGLVVAVAVVVVVVLYTVAVYAAVVQWYRYTYMYSNCIVYVPDIIMQSVEVE